MFMWDVLLAMHNFRELKNLANNAKIKYSLKFLLHFTYLNMEAERTRLYRNNIHPGLLSEVNYNTNIHDIKH